MHLAGRLPELRAEATRVGEAQDAPGIEAPVDMIVRTDRRRCGQHAQRARHAQMQQRAARFRCARADISRGVRSRRCAGRAASCAALCGIGQRRRGWRMSSPTTVRPIRCGASPRRVVSTSGSSGIVTFFPFSRLRETKSAGCRFARRSRRRRGAGCTECTCRRRMRMLNQLALTLSPLPRAGEGICRLSVLEVARASLSGEANSNALNRSGTSAIVPPTST